MVWIHGGSYKSGAGDASVYDPAELVEEQGVVVVSVSYRLGLFGFLGGYAGRAANLGLLDIAAALRWVSANISSFGGDEGNVTLFGQSAGGDAIAHLMIAEGVDGLFQRVIIQSAPLGISGGRRRMTDAMCRVASGISVKDSAAEVVAKQDGVVEVVKGFGLKGGMPFGTQYSHDPLPSEEEADATWRARAPQYDVLIGCTLEETSLFLVRMKAIRQLTQMPIAGRALKHLLVRNTTGKVYRKAAAAFARRHAKSGGCAYLYNLHWGSSINEFGATHTMDLPLLFGSRETWQHSELLRGIAEQERVENGRKLRALWARFARTGRLDEEDKTCSHFISYKRVARD
jgi:para-nitrobenzyl esterase